MAPTRTPARRKRCSGRGMDDNRSMMTETRSVPLSLRANFSWAFAGNVVYGGFQWAVLVVIAKLGNPEMVGQFALALAVTSPVILFANLQLGAILATDARSEFQFRDYLTLRLIATGLALLVVAGIAILAGYRRETIWVILMVGTAKGFEAVSDVLYGFFQKYERMDRVGKSMIMKGPLSLIGVALGLYITGSILWGAVGLAISWAFILLSYDVHNAKLILRAFPQQASGTSGIAHEAKRRSPIETLSTLAQLAWLALPLGFARLLASLNASIPRFFIERHLGEWELGIFAAMAYLMVVGNRLMHSLGQSVSPRLSRYYTEGNWVALRTLTLKLMGIGTGLGAVSILAASIAGKEILTLLYRPEYAGHITVFVWLMVAASIDYLNTFLWYTLTAVRRLKAQALLLLATVVSMTALCALLTPLGGFVGAAISIVIAASVQFVGSVMVAWRTLFFLSLARPQGGAGLETPL